MGASVITEHDAIAILNSDGVIDRLNVSPESIEKGDLYLINDRMLLILMDWGQAMVEAHIAEPKPSWPHIHRDIDDALIFIQSLGYTQVYTNVRNKLKTTLNLLSKHGFNAVKVIESEVILKWEHNQ
jgi:hypothetical protein